MTETTLTLPLKRKWFDLIRSDEKREEYREMSPYGKRRLERIAMALENLALGRGVNPCWYCTPGLSNTTEQKNFHYCPICWRKLIKED